MTKIAVPLDGSPLAECVLPHVLTLARVFEAGVKLIQVIEQPRLACRGPGIDPLDWQLCKAQSRRYLEDQAERLEHEGLTTEVVLLEGDPAQEIVGHVREDEQITLIVMSSHGQNGLSGWNISSVVQKILVRVSITAFIVRAFQTAEQDHASYPRILVALDGSQRAEIALPFAQRLAAAQSADLVLAHIVPRPEMPRRTPLSANEVQLSEQLVDRNRDEARQYLEVLQARAGEHVVTRLVVGDQVAERLHEIVREEEIALVVLSAHGYSGPRRRPFGSIAQDFIEFGETALLLVQDLPREALLQSPAELAVHQQQGH